MTHWLPPTSLTALATAAVLSQAAGAQAQADERPDGTCTELLDVMVQQISEGAGPTAEQKAMDHAFIRCLQEYIRVDTISREGEVGREYRGVNFLYPLLDRYGIERSAHVTKHEPDGPAEADDPRETDWRVSLIGVLRAEDSDETTESIGLLSHSDVVDVPDIPVGQPGGWRYGEGLSGDAIWLDEAGEPVPAGTGTEYILGRGALDMKDITIMQLVSMIALKTRGTPLERDIYLLVVAGEESGGIGARALLTDEDVPQRHPSLPNLQVILNEMSIGVPDIMGSGVNLMTVVTEGRGTAQQQLTAKDPAAILHAMAELALLEHHEVTAADQLESMVDQWWASIWDCELTSVRTENAKLNVVPAKVSVELTCDNPPSDATIVDRFEYDNGITANVTRDGEKIHVTVSTETSSHGSAPVELSALRAAAYGVLNMTPIDTKYTYELPALFNPQITPAMDTLFDRLVQNQTLVPSFPSHLIPLELQELFVDVVEGFFPKTGVLRNHCNWTKWDYTKGGNNEAYLDCRIIDQSTAVVDSHVTNFGDALAAYLAAEVKEALEIEPFDGRNYTSSSIDTWQWETVEEVLQENFPEFTVSPMMAGGSTDSCFFRDPQFFGEGESWLTHAVPSFGLTPIVDEMELLETAHGNDERFPAASAGRAVVTYEALLTRLAGATE